MSRLSRVIAPMLQAAGLDARPVGRADGELQELIVTSPRQPSWCRVVINRDGLMQRDHCGGAVTDRGAADIAAVVIAIMASRPGHDPRTMRPQPSAERARSRP